jgi:peroxiredoxin
MRLSSYSPLLVALLATSAFAQQRAIVAKPKGDAAVAHFETLLGQALGALAQAGSYSVDVDSKWGALNDPQGPRGGSRYRLISQGGKFRVEVQSQAAQTPELVCVHDGQQMTTFFPSRNLYSQHAANSPAASLESNAMLALSLQGSAIDILLQRDVAGFVRSQATGLIDHGQVMLAGRKAQHFEVEWGGAKVELWFAAEGEPLLLQFTRTTSVPTVENNCYEMVCTANFKWQLGAVPQDKAFALAIPQNARRVNEIYHALAEDETSAHVGKPLPKLQLATLDGNEVELAAAAGKKATVLVFWATWNAASVTNMPAISQLVQAYQQRGVEFFAVNVGEQPGDVRRFIAKSPLVSTVLLDPRGKASAALQVTEMPAIAIIGADNNVRAILQGSAKKLQGDLVAQLDSLLGTAGASTAQRPGKPPQAK